MLVLAMFVSAIAMLVMVMRFLLFLAFVIDYLLQTPTTGRLKFFEEKTNLLPFLLFLHLFQRFECEFQLCT